METSFTVENAERLPTGSAGAGPWLGYSARVLRRPDGTAAAVLADAAFGACPGRAALPPARTPLQRWHRAVALGGTGRYAAARAELAPLTRAADPVLRSLALSTTGSLVRQSGRHTAAAGPDGRAALAAAPPPAAVPRGRAKPSAGDATAASSGSESRAEAALSVTRLPASRAEAAALAAFGATAVSGSIPVAGSIAVPDRLDAWCDALTGLAADALGSARPALAFRLLCRVDTALGGAIAAADPDPPRPRAVLRGHWVTAETALSVGDATTALRHAEAAVVVAERMPSVRHRVKSALLRAAATAAAGRAAESAALAEPVAAACAEHDLLPLRWATAMLRSGLGVAGAAAEAAECAVILRGRGGMFSAPVEY